MLDFAHRVVDSRKMSPGGYLRNYTDKLKNRFAEYVTDAVWLARLVWLLLSLCFLFRASECVHQHARCRVGRVHVSTA